MTTKILLVEDHPIVRLGYVTLLLQANPSLVVHETDNAREAVMLAKEHAPAVALVDLSLAGTLSFELIKELNSVSPTTAILVVSMHDELAYAERALRAGARGYVMKQAAAQFISEAVCTVKEGGIWLSKELSAQIVNRVVMAEPRGGVASLSDREIAVLRLISRGLKKGDMAKELNLSPNTIETYRTNIKQKLGIPTGAALYKFAFVHFEGGSHG